MRIRTHHLLSGIAIAAFAGISPAYAAITHARVAPLSVYPGCEKPKVNTAAKAYYVDPVKGTDAGDGSAAKPWKSLSTVIATKVATNKFKAPYLNKDGTLANGAAIVPFNANAPIKGGDTIYLMNGNHGAVRVMGANADFITVKAAPGQKPVLAQLTVLAAKRWVFQGLKVQASLPNYGNLIGIQSHSYAGPVDQIIVDGNNVSTVDDTSQWSQADWRAKATFRGIATSGAKHATCVAITNNTIKNLYFGSGFAANNSLFAGNVVDTFGADGVDFGADNITIANNYFTNSLDLGDDKHRDAIQGFGPQVGGYKNIKIDRNLVIRQSNPNLTFSNGFQGINAFDTDWHNVSVTNNIVITDAYHGMTWGSVHGGVFANNTVINDGLNVNKSTRINLGGKTHTGGVSNDITVRNNIATAMIMNYDAPNLVVDHNVTEWFIYTQTGVKGSYNKKPGVYKESNFVVPAFYSNFTAYAPSNFNYDVRPVAGSKAIDNGALVRGLSTDYYGLPNVAPVDIGAVAVQAK